MNLCRCEKGHFYDKEKFESCQHCAQGVQADESLTTVFTEDLDGSAQSDFGQFEQQEVPVMQQEVPVMQQPNVVMPEPDATEPIAQNNMGGIQMENNYDNTYGNMGTAYGNSYENMGNAFEPAREVTVDEIEQPKINPGNVADDDDDHTVAFYDDIFASSTPMPSPEPAISNAAVPKTATAPSSGIRRGAQSPCTGWLISLDGAHIGQDFRLKVGKNFIGRDASMDVALVGDRSVSRNRHAILVYEPKQHLYLVQPGESSELVYLNDEVVLSPMRLKEYDVITVGEVNLLFMPLCGERFNWTDYLKNRK